MCLFKRRKKLRGWSNRDLGMFTLGLVIGAALVLFLALGTMHHIFALIGRPL